MTTSFQALVIDQVDGKPVPQLKPLTQADLPVGEVLVAIDYSSINYKDAMALTGTGKIIRSFPMVPGIDFAGTVVESSSADYKPGDKVVLTGWSVGERFWGGYSQMQRVKAEWLVPLPANLSSQSAMAIGTAGLTAMLCVMALAEQGVTPESGEILVTGASGGVGSVAIAILAARGYKVVASTGKLAEADYLKSLGAVEVMDRAALSAAGKPLQKERWAGVVDSVGSHTLVNAVAQVRYGGAVAACGLAQGMDFPASVAPFILRSVKLIGVDSVMAPRARRIAAWDLLAKELKAETLATITQEIKLADALIWAPKILAGEVRGRLVVNVKA